MSLSKQWKIEKSIGLVRKVAQNTTEFSQSDNDHPDQSTISLPILHARRQMYSFPYLLSALKFTKYAFHNAPLTTNVART